MAGKNEQEVKNSLFGFGEPNEAFGQYFIGQSFLKGLVNEDDVDVMVANVSFEPGCRNNWHKHVGGYQILLVTEGEGWYQEDGQAARKLTAGDVVVIKDGVKHWHGATKDSWFNHVAITAGEGEWLEPVDDEHYNALEG